MKLAIREMIKSDNVEVANFKPEKSYFNNDFTVSHKLKEGSLDIVYNNEVYGFIPVHDFYIEVYTPYGTIHNPEDTIRFINYKTRDFLDFKVGQIINVTAIKKAVIEYTDSIVEKE